MNLSVLLFGCVTGVTRLLLWCRGREVIVIILGIEVYRWVAPLRLFGYARHGEWGLEGETGGASVGVRSMLEYFVDLLQKYARSYS